MPALAGSVKRMSNNNTTRNAWAGINTEMPSIFGNVNFEALFAQGTIKLETVAPLPIDRRALGDELVMEVVPQQALDPLDYDDPASFTNDVHRSVTLNGSVLIRTTFIEMPRNREQVDWKQEGF